MKKSILFPIAIAVISCCNTKSSISTTNMKNNSENVKIEDCPENGDCHFEILQNKGLSIKTNTIGEKYYEIEDNLEKVVFVYKYQQKVKDTTLQDAGYREEIAFEMDKNYSDFSLANKQLQSTKMIFGVFCYCKGKAGYYTVREGSIVKKGSQLLIDITPVVDNQKITKAKISL